MAYHHNQHQPVSPQDYYPEENYEAMRRPIQVQESALDTDSAAHIAYKPVSEPAWDRHKPQLAPKSARFEKLTRWGQRSNAVQSAVAWAVVAAGAATIAGPAILTHLPH